MEHDDHDQHAGAPVVQAAHEAAGCDFRQDILEAVVSLARRRRIVEGQQYAGKRLHQEQEQGYAAKYLVPSARGWDLLIEEIADRGRNAGAMLQPLVDSRPMAHADMVRRPTKSLFPSTLVSYRCSGCRAGPPITLPSMANSELWHGQKNSSLVLSQW